MLRPALTACCLTWALSAPAAQAADWIWVEAETAVDKREQANDWYDPVDRQTSLSGQDWWHSFDETGMESGYAAVPFAVAEAGSYRLWIRLNTQATGYTWAIDDAEPTVLPLDQWREEAKEHEWDLDYERRIYDTCYAAHDGSNRHNLVWVSVDDLQLAAGDHTIRLAVKPGKDGKGYAAVDCLVFAKQGFAFRPRLFYKPGEQVQVAQEVDPADAWIWPDIADDFPETPIDLRRLNETEAGEHGFIRLSDDGNDFVRGDGEPIRFWSGSDYFWRQPFNDDNLKVSEQEQARVARHARWAAKRGINMVRFHGHLPPRRQRGGPSPSKDDINEIDLHGAWYMVAAFKQEGIYSTISPYWGSHTDNEEAWELGFTGGSLAGLVFFYEPVQEMYKQWVTRLYGEVNPYTGIRLADDPALAIIQLQNEDSLLFFTAGTIKGEPLKVLTKKFGAFCAEKYGSFDLAYEALNREWESGWDMNGEDSREEQTLGVLQPWFLSLDAGTRAQKWANPQIRARLDCQLEFLTRLMYDWNKETARFLREDLGCKQIINAGNWKAVDDTSAGDAERWSYCANEVIGKNAYYGAIHNGINNGWQILSQHVYTNWSALKRPRFWPMNVKQVVGKPFIIPESLWVPPNLYSSEGPLLVAGQLSLTGVDSFYWFASGTQEWADVHNKWPYNTPMQMGQFPATALAFRQGYIKEATEPVVYEERSDEDIWKQRSPIIAENAVYDPNRDTGEMPTESTVTTAVDPLAFCAGPVHVKYQGDAANNRVSPKLAELIDSEAKTVTSITGEIRTDFAKGIYTVNAPKIQAAAGFLAEQPVIALAEVSIRCRNDYASIVVVSLDDQPIASSKQLLVQVGTKARPTGWIARARDIENGGKHFDGFQILRTGSEPLQVANTHAEVQISNSAVTTATALDINGAPMDQDVTVRRDGGVVFLTLPPNALYTVLSAE